MRNDAGELIGINKTLSSSIKVLLEEQVVQDVYYYKQIDGNLTPENEVPPFERELRGFNWRGEERLESIDDLFAGEPPLELTRIEGIPLPSPETEFFEEREEDDPLLNEKSRLRPDDLKTRKQDSISPQPQEILPEPLIEAEKEE